MQFDIFLFPFAYRITIKSNPHFYYISLFVLRFFPPLICICFYVLLSFYSQQIPKKEHLLQLFHAAVSRQTDIMVMNILGHGVDIPLLGLREACKELNNGELCELFTDESYPISQCFLLSTSQVCLVHRSNLFDRISGIT